MTFARHYDQSAYKHDHDGRTAELHLTDHAVAQVSEIPEDQGSGFLIRVWPPNGTHEYGGNNSTALCAVVKFVDDNWIVESLNIDKKWTYNN